MEYPFLVDVNLKGNQIREVRIDNLTGNPASPGEGRVYYNTTDKKFWGYNGTTWIDLSMTVTAATSMKGEITNANTSPAFPSNPAAGDMYFITTNAGTVGGLEVEVGDMLIYGTSGFFVLQRNLQAATASLAGFARFATQAEANAGSMNNVSINPQTLAGFLANYLYARKVVTLIASLAANTETTVTHGLGLVAAEDLQVQCYQGGIQIALQVKPTSVNAITVASNTALGNVKVVIQA